MDSGENPQLKKSRSAQNITGPRFGASFANAFSATKQARSNAGSLRSPFARLNNNTTFTNQHGMERTTVKRERQDDDGLVATTRITRKATADRPDYVSADDSRLARTYHSLHATNHGSGKSQLLPNQVYLTDLRKAGSYSSKEPTCLPDYHSEWSALDISKTTQDSQDASFYPFVISPTHSSPMTNLFNSPIVKSSTAVVRTIHDYQTSDDHRISHSSVPVKSEEIADDLSVLMFKGATDLRSAKIALEQKTEESERLTDEIQTLTAERDGLLQRINLIKQKTKEALDINSKSMSEWGTAMESLKTRAQDCFSLVDTMRTSQEEFEAAKGTAKETLKRIDSLIVGDNSFLPTQEWRNVLTEVRLEIVDKQQVIDLLRDKLEFHLGEYAGARNRVAEIEKMQREDINALRETSDILIDAELKVFELATTLKEQQDLNIDILVKNAELEACVKAHEAEESDLRQNLSEKDRRVLEIAPLHDECLKLRALIEDRDIRLLDLQALKEGLASQTDINKELRMMIAANDTMLTDTKDAMMSTQCSLVQAETLLSEQNIRMNNLEKELVEARKQVSNELEQRIKLVAGREALIQQISDLDSRLKSKEAESYEFRTRVQQSDVKYESLQDKFDEQTLMLRMEKKTHGDVQERLFTSEALHIRTLEECKQAYEVKMARLQEQNITLENRLQERAAELETKQQEFFARAAQLQENHAKEMREAAIKLDYLTQSRNSVKKDLEEAAAETQTLFVKIQMLQVEVSGLHKELLEARMPSEAHLQEVASFKAQMMILQKEKDEIELKSKTIIARYETGELSPEEKLLIDTIHRSSQSSHEQQLFAKGNEIRQRDNLLKALEKRKCDLETQLAQLLNVQVKEKTDMNIVPSRSLIDPDNWMSSQTSSSPLRNKIRASDRDGTTTLLDIDVAETFTTVDPRDIHPALHVEPDQGASVDCSPPALKRPKSPTVTSFTKLGQSADDSDEIRDFHNARQDSVAPPKRKRDNRNLNMQEYGKFSRLTRSKTKVNRNPSSVVATEVTDTFIKPNATATKAKARKRR